ncbi:response regulator [Xanthobacter agilis]|uniref:DNA-binding response OmpR family regulator n=1 Tax=Xanthobacter agilis TaxID=47492 RepID=A0ABU0LFC0_XANAG|nr:response regulator [Xanthobacter agilis]MDQ0505808.1 DNA-binding response OmpR family regulator [Xanthobacter agilis]
MTALRILIVEDDAVIGMHLAEVLEGMGHDVCSIEATEAGAVAAADRDRPDLMIVDAWLQDGSGVCAVKTICRNGHVPHVFISGDVARVKAALPAAVVVQKPFREDVLARIIQHVIDDMVAPRSP